MQIDLVCYEIFIVKLFFKQELEKATSLSTLPL
jgi:hypothetical protein